VEYDEIRQALRDASNAEQAEAAMAEADRWAAENEDDPRVIDLSMAVHVVAQKVEDNRAT
jgi:hypothetical protein